VSSQRNGPSSKVSASPRSPSCLQHKRGLVCDVEGDRVQAFRKDFLASCVRSLSRDRDNSLELEPESPPLALAHREHVHVNNLSSLAKSVDELQQSEASCSSWQKRVNADLTKNASELTQVTASLKALQQQLGRVENYLQEQMPRLLAQVVTVTSQRPSTNGHDGQVGLLRNSTSSRSESTAGLESALRGVVTDMTRVLQECIAQHFARCDQRSKDQFEDLQVSCTRIEKELRLTTTGPRPSVVAAQVPSPLFPREDNELDAGMDSSVDETHRTSRTPIAINLDVMHRLSNASKESGAVQRSSLFSSSRSAYKSVTDDVFLCLRYLEWVSCLLIIFNTAFLGVSLLVSFPHVKSGKQPPGWLQIVDGCFLVAFVFELGIRLALEKKLFATGPNKWMNAFDVLVTILQALEAIEVLVGNVVFVRILKSLRVFRAARLLRSIGGLKYVRLLTNTATWQPLLWGFGVLASIIYFFSVLVCQTLVNWLELTGAESIDPVQRDALYMHYGSLGHTMVSFIMAITGGEEWSKLVEPLEAISAWYKLLFLCYTFSITFGVMNIMTGLYVNVVTKVCDREQDLQMLKHAKKDKDLIEKLKTLLIAADKYQHGTLSREAIVKVIHNDEDNRHILRGLNLEEDVTKTVYKLLDVQERNRVSIEEFCQSLLHFTSSVHNVHIAMLMLQSRRTLVKIDRFEKDVAGQLDRLESNMIMAGHFDRIGNRITGGSRSA